MPPVRGRCAGGRAVVPEHGAGHGLAAAPAVVLVVGHGRTARVVRSGQPTAAATSSLRRVAAVVVVVAYVVVHVTAAIVVVLILVVHVVVVFVAVVVTTSPIHAVVVVVVVVVMVPAVLLVVVVVVVTVSADDGVGGGCPSPAGNVVLHRGGHQRRGGTVTVEPRLQELVGGQKMVARVHQTGRVQRRTAPETGQRRRRRLLVLLLVVVVLLLLVVVVMVVRRRPVAAVMVMVLLRVVTTDGRRGRRSVLVLQQAMDLEPVRSATVPRPALGHAHQQTFAQPARFARRSVLLIDHALAVVLAFRYRTQVVVRPTEKRLQQTRVSFR